MSPIAPPSSSVGNDNKQTPGGVRSTLRWLGVNAPQTQQQQEEHVAPDKTAAPPQPTQHKIRRPLPSNPSAATLDAPETQDSITATPPKPKAFVTALRAPQTEPKPRSAPPAAASSTDENGGSITVSGSQPVAPVSRARYSMAAVSSIFSRAPSSVQAQKTETMVEVENSISVEAPRQKRVANGDSDSASSPEDEIQAKASDDDDDDGEDSDVEQDAEEAEESIREPEPDRDGEAPSSPASGRKPAPGYHESIWDPPFSPQAKKSWQPRAAARRRSSSAQNPPSSAIRRSLRHSSPVLADMDEEGKEEEEEPAEEQPTRGSGKRSARTRVAGAKTNGATATTQAAPQPAARRGRSDRQSAKAKDAVTAAAAATTSAAEAGAAADSDVESDEESVTDANKFEIAQLVNHRPSQDGENLFELQVLWYHPEDEEAEDVTWEPEDVIHRDAPTLLFAYWRSLKGGREAQMEDPDLWFVSHVKNHRVSPDGSRVSLHVSWIGSPQATWEPEANVEESAPEAVAEYWAAKGGRDRVISGATAKKRGAARGGGRGGRGGSRKRIKS